MKDENKLRIFNVACTVFNLPPFKLSDLESEDKTTIPNLVTFETLLDTALNMAIREHDWSFLTSIIPLGKDLGKKGDFLHSYAIPSEVFRLVDVHSSRYSVMGAFLLTDRENPIVTAILKDFDENPVPLDFYDMVGYALAYYASSSVNSGDTKTSTAMVLYEQLKQRLITSDARNNIGTDIDSENMKWLDWC